MAVFWVIAYKIWHICLPLLGHTRNRVKLKQIAGPKGLYTRGGTAQEDVPAEGNAGQAGPTGHYCCLVNVRLSVLRHKEGLSLLVPCDTFYPMSCKQKRYVSHI